MLCLLILKKRRPLALAKTFDNLRLTFCLFHLSKNNYNNIVQLGFKQKYSNDLNFSLKVRSFTALALIPVNDVIPAFEELIEDDEIPEEFIHYFEKNYVGLEKGRGKNKRRENPRFLIQHWNVHNRILNGLPRTNNSCEGCNNSFKNNLTQTHPNIWSLIDALKNEESLSRNKMAHWRKGELPKKRKNINMLRSLYLKF